MLSGHGDFLSFNCTYGYLKMADNFFINNFITVFLKANRITFTRFLGILSPRLWINGYREVNERMKEVLRMEWRGMALSVSGWSVAILTARCECR